MTINWDFLAGYMLGAFLVYSVIGIEIEKMIKFNMHKIFMNENICKKTIEQMSEIKLPELSIKLSKVMKDGEWYDEPSDGYFLTKEQAETVLRALIGAQDEMNGMGCRLERCKAIDQAITIFFDKEK